MSDDDDLRFGDVGGNKGGSGSVNFDPGPLLGAVAIAVVLLIIRPTGDIMLDIGVVLLVVVGGIMGSFNY